MNVDTIGLMVLESRFGTGCDACNLNEGRWAMYFNVSQLLREGSGSARSYRVDDVVRFPLEGRDARVTGVVNMLKTDLGIWVSASLGSMASVNCSRCLKSFVQPVHMDIEEEYIPLADVETGAAVTYGDEFDECFRIDRTNILDMTEAVRQYSELTMPMKPVCDEMCAGICLMCGADLNDGPCGCDRRSTDPRWEALRSLALPGEGES